MRLQSLRSRLIVETRQQEQVARKRFLADFFPAESIYQYDQYKYYAGKSKAYVEIKADNGQQYRLNRIDPCCRLMNKSQKVKKTKEEYPVLGSRDPEDGDQAKNESDQDISELVSQSLLQYMRERREDIDVE